MGNFLSDAWKKNVHEPIKDQWRSFTGQKQAEKLARDQMGLSEEMARMGIRWRVEDAKAAGLHPMAALGASTPTYSGGQSINPGQSGIQGVAQLAGIIGMLTNMFSSIKGQETAGQRSSMGNRFTQQDQNTGRVEVVPVTQEMLNKADGTMRAGIHPQLSWEPSNTVPGLVKLNAGPNAVGIEEDPGAVIRRQTFININLPKLNRKYRNPSNRKGPGWNRFKKMIISMEPNTTPQPGKRWIWSFQHGGYMQKPKYFLRFGSS